MKHKRLDLAIALGLAALTVLCYWPAWDNDFIDYDDPEYVTDNPRVQEGLTWPGVCWALTTTDAANWHPLTWLSLQLDASLFGPGPFGFHLTNVLLHAANAVLLFAFLGRAAGRTWPAALVAGLFALHPLHVESVAWVAERKDVLSTFFWLLALLAYLGYARRPGALRYAAVAAALALGLLAKPMLVTLPCVLLLLDWWPLRRAERPGRLVLEKLPLLALAAASAALTIYAQRGSHAFMPLAAIGPLERVGNALVAYVVYLRKALWPTDLAIFYVHPGQHPVLHVLGAGLVLALVTVLCLWARRARPYLAVGWLWYLGTLVPVIGLVQVGTQAWADRYTYVPLIGIFLMVAWGAADLAARFRVPRPALAALAAAGLLACGIGTRVQLTYWRDGAVIWDRALSVAPCWLAHDLLGRYYFRRERYGEAWPHYVEAQRLYPNDSDIHLRLGMILERWGRLPEAEQQLRTAARLDPHLVRALDRLAAVQAKQGHVREALVTLAAVLREDPNNGVAQLRCGILLEQQGQGEAAVARYRAALAASPRLEQAHYFLGTRLAKQGKLDEAIDHLAEAVRLEPRDAQAHEDLGHAYKDKGQYPQALAAFREAVRLDPDNAHHRLSLAALLRRLGRGGEAREEYGRALQLDPGWPARYGRAAWAFATHADAAKRKPKRAVELAEEACLAAEGPRPELLDALAAAYAAAGRFDDATAAARRALSLARAGDQAKLVTPLEQRLRLYEAHRPFRDASLH